MEVVEFRSEQRMNWKEMIMKAPRRDQRFFCILQERRSHGVFVLPADRTGQPGLNLIHAGAPSGTAASYPIVVDDQHLQRFLRASGDQPDHQALCDTSRSYC